MLQRLAFWILVTLLIVYSALPFYWALNTSLKGVGETDAAPTMALPTQPTLEHYVSVLQNSLFVRSIVNSAVVAGSVTFIGLLFGGLAAYALGRFRFRYRGVVRYIVIFMSLFPTIAILPSVFALMRDLHLTGTIASLILVYPIFVLPTVTLSMVIFFRELPPDIEQAAYVDGANAFQLFTRVLLPIATPLLVTSGLATFVSVWSEYLLAITLVSVPPEARTIASAIKFLSASLSPQELMAGAVILTVPLFAIIVYTRRQFLTNTLEGAVKG